MKLSLKRFLPRTLFARSLLILVIPALLLQIITTYIFFDRHWTKMTDRLAYAVAGEINVMSDRVEQGVDNAQMQQLSGYAAQDLDMLVSFEPGAKMAADRKEKHHSLVVITLDQALEAQVQRPHQIHVDTEEKWVDVTLQLNNGLLHVSLPQRRLFSSSGYIFLLWMMGTSIVLLAVAILFMRNQIRPIRRLAVAAERFGKGMEVPANFKPEGAAEVRQAARAFIDMHGRIKRQMQQRTAMLAGVSHDLRTPLTRMKLQVSMLGNTSDADELKRDIADMERMINAYLDFARGQGTEQASRTDLKELLERVISGARRQGIEAELKTEGELVLQLRPIAFERCIANIVSNARKYATHLWVIAERQENTIRICFDDNGPGIPESQYEDMFRPFVRGEPSRNPETGGVGLGLPIAQDIITGHGGRIWLEKSPHGGLRVMVELPV